MKHVERIWQLRLERMVAAHCICVRRLYISATTGIDEKKTEDDIVFWKGG